MQRFLLHCLAFFTVLCLVSLALTPVRSLFWGNEDFAVKMDHLAQNKDSFNTLFVGSSRIYRQLDPAVFDEELADLGTSTFNLAVLATFNPESYYMVDRLLDKVEAGSLPAVDTVFVELLTLRPPTDVNLDSDRNYYWRNWENTRFVMDYIQALPASLATGQEEPTDSLRYLGYRLGYSLLGRDLDFRWKGGYSDHALSTLGPAGNGFFDLDSEWAAISSGELSDNDRDLGARIERRRQDFRIVERRAERIRLHTATGRGQQAANPVHLARLEALMDRGDTLGVRIVFLIAPRGGVVSYFGRQALRAALPASRVIDLSNPDEFPEFHLPRYSFDRAHLNAKGTRLFTREVARQARPLLSGNTTAD